MSAAGPCRTRRGLPTVRAPLRRRVLLRSVSALPRGGVVQGVGWSKMRLGFAVFGGPSTGVVQNTSQFDGFGRIQAISGRLRRILDQASGKTPDPPETQTHFGPPSRRTTKQPDHQAAGRSGCWGTKPLFRKAPSPPGSRGGWAITKRCGSAARPLPHRAPGAAGRPIARPFRLRALCRVAYAGLARGSRQVEHSSADSPAGEPPRGIWTRISKKAPVPSNHINGTGAFGALAPPTRSPERRRRRPPGRPRPASSPAPRGRARWRRRRTAGSCRPCAAPGNPSSSPRPSCPG